MALGFRAGRLIAGRFAARRFVAGRVALASFAAGLAGCGNSSDTGQVAPPVPPPFVVMEPPSSAAEPPAASQPALAPEVASTGSNEASPGTLPLKPSAPSAADGPSAAADAGAPATPSVDVTNGSGGPVGPNDLTSKGGLSFKIDAPAGNTPRGLLVLLHGSTASNYTSFISMMQTVAKKYDLIPVSVLAPNGQGWNEGNQVQGAELLHRLVQEDLYTLYNVDKNRVLFSGQSSGGGFLSSNFIPAHAKDYKGGAFLQCGAAPPNLRFAPDAVTRQDFRMHFEITTGDPIWPASYAAAIAAYGAVQMQFSMDNTKPGGHCAFDQQQVILDHIDFVLGGAAAAAAP